MDNKDQPDNNDPGRRSSFQNIVFWMFILSLPVFLIFSMNRNKNKGEITQSRFEASIKEKRVKDVKLFSEPNNLNSCTVEGKYKPTKEELENDAKGIEGKKEIKLEDDGYTKFRVRVMGLEKVVELLRDNQITFETQVRSSVMGEALGYLLPVMIFLILIYFLFSRQLRKKCVYLV